MRRMITLFAANVIALGTLGSCERQSSPPPAKGPAAHVEDEHAHEGGAVIQLGSSTIGPFAVTATRDDGPLTPGKDAPIDATVTSTSGAKASAVRFWIGVEDAKGSIKARADIENPAEPNHWHTHAEIPDPMPAGSKLWVEIEDDKSQTHKGSFDLKSGG